MLRRIINLMRYRGARRATRGLVRERAKRALKRTKRSKKR